MEGRTRLAHLHVLEHSTFYILNIHTNSIKRNNTQTHPMVEIYAY